MNMNMEMAHWPPFACTHRVAKSGRCSNAPGAIDCSPADWTSSVDRAVKFSRVD